MSTGVVTPLKPRIVLAALSLAAVLGVALSWLDASAVPVVPAASWVAVVALGTTLVGSALRPGGRVPADFPGRARWRRLVAAAVAVSVLGLAVRLAGSRQAILADATSVGLAVVAGGLAVVAVVSAATSDDSTTGSDSATGSDSTTGVDLEPSGGSPVDARWSAVAASLLAAAGLVGLSRADAGPTGGVALLVRTVHVLAVGVWLGAAVWHNAVAVPAVGRDGGRAVRQVARRIQRAVPALLVVVLATGLYQAARLLGTGASPYLTTLPGRLVVLKLVLLAVVGTLVVATHVRTPFEGPAARSES